MKEKTNLPAIPPCRFCNSENVKLNVIFIAYSIYVVCLDCKAMGPLIKMNGKPEELENQKKEAINAWGI